MPLEIRKQDGVTQEGRPGARLEKRVQACRGWDRQIRPTLTFRGDGEGNKYRSGSSPHCLEKPLTMDP